MQGLQSCFMDINGAQLHYRLRPASLSVAPTVIFLHGFPESSRAWLKLFKYLPESWCLVAPDLPGYAQSDVLPDASDYQVPALIKRLTYFIEQFKGTGPLYLFGHDWGGAIAWPLAAFNPDLIDHLFILNAAHPSTFTREMVHNQRQRQKSAYIHTLINPHAQSTLQADNFALMAGFFSHDDWQVDQHYLQALKEEWAQSEHLDAMLEYYRQMPQMFPAGSENEAGTLSGIRIPKLMLTQPVSVMWGLQDDAFVPEIIDGLEAYIPKLDVVIHEKASHWVHHQDPEWVAAQLLSRIK